LILNLKANLLYLIGKNQSCLLIATGQARGEADRVVSFLTDLHYTGQNVLLFGFGDSTGGRQVNEALSRDRAGAVARLFEQRGIKASAVVGFGSQLPVASNETVDGREKNRRVEIWLRK